MQHLEWQFSESWVIIYAKICIVKLSYIIVIYEYIKLILLSVVILNVIMLIVVAPFSSAKHTERWLIT